MKTFARTLRLLGILATLIGLLAARANDNPISLNGPNMIQAGASWSLAIAVRSAEAGETVQATLINGLSRLDETLTLGSGGVALWRIPDITQAGQGMAYVRYGEHMRMHHLRVRPGPVAQADLFASANTLTAYGEAESTIMLLPRDAYGNPPAPDSMFAATVRYPNGERATLDFTYDAGLAWATLRSVGGPGRVRVALDHPTLDATLELQQTPSAANTIALAHNADCLLADGRDLLTLQASVQDAAGYPVSDGTLVTFRWADSGLGYGQTLDGEATLRLPAPQQVGRYNYHAGAGNTESDAVTVRVADDCEVRP